MAVCIRVYPNMSYAREDRSLEPNKKGQTLAYWMAYNEYWRFGCALFVNSICVYPGTLPQSDIDSISSFLSGNGPPVLRSEYNWELVTDPSMITPMKPYVQYPDIRIPNENVKARYDVLREVMDGNV